MKQAEKCSTMSMLYPGTSLTEASMDIKSSWHLLKMDLERAILSPGFFLAICVTFAALHIGAGMGSDINPSSTIVYLFTYAVKWGDAKSVIIFASSFAYAASYCVDRHSGMIKFIISRSDEKKYALCKCISCGFAGGLSVMVGALLYLLYLLHFGLALMPAQTVIEVEYSQQAFGDILMQQKPWLYFACLLAVLFIQGSFWSILGLCASGYMPNKYIAYSTPFIASFLSVEALNMLGLPRWLWLAKMSFAGDDFGGSAWTIGVTTCVFLVLIVLSSLLFIRQVQRSMSND